MMSSTIYLNKIPILKCSGETYDEILELINKLTKLTAEEFYLTRNGKLYTKSTGVDTENFDIKIQIKANGGKGGFGSMLRAIGAQIEKTTNKEACRDLSGRRLRDINEEKKLKAWLEKQKDREEEAKERKRRKLEKLVAVPKHEFKDPNYENARSELTEKLSQAVEEGFKKAQAAGGVKRKVECTSTLKKKPGLWFDDDLSSGSSTDSDSSDNSVCKKPKTSTGANNSHDEGSSESSNSNKSVENDTNSASTSGGLDEKEASCSNEGIVKKDLNEDDLKIKVSE